MIILPRQAWDKDRENCKNKHGVYAGVEVDNLPAAHLRAGVTFW